MRAFLAFLALGIAGNAPAQIVSRDSVHLKPIGTVVSGSFVLGSRAIPLPEGKYVLAAVELHDSRFVRGDFSRQQHKMVDVALAEMADGKLRSYVWATTVLKYGGRTGWVMEPCKTQDVIFKQSRVPYMKSNYEQNCLTVNQSGSLGTQSTGAYATLGAWVRSQGGTTPIQTMVHATITRIIDVDYVAVRYAFNTDAYGCVVKRDEPSPFVDAVIGLGKELQTVVNEGFVGRGQEVVDSLAAGLPVIEGCGAARHAAPAKRGNSPPVAERLKALDALRDQGLISPAEYEERRKKILDSL